MGTQDVVLMGAGPWWLLALLAALIGAWFFLSEEVDGNWERAYW